MRNYLLHRLFLENAKNLGRSNEAKRSKTGNSLRGQKKLSTPTNEDLGQTSKCSKLVAAYLPVARLTILDRLVFFFFPRSVTNRRLGSTVHASLMHAYDTWNFNTEVVVAQSY